MARTNFNSLTQTQKETFKETFFSEETITTLFSPMDHFFAILTLNGNKPATTIETYYQPLETKLPDPADIETALDAIDATYTSSRPRRPDPDADEGESKIIELTIVSHAGHTPHEIHTSDLTPRERGLAYGYPEPAVTAFTDPETDTNTRPYKYAMTELNYSLTEIQYMYFTQFATPLTKDAIDTRIHKGKEYIQALRSLATTHNFLEPLHDLLDSELAFARKKIIHDITHE